MTTDYKAALRAWAEAAADDAHPPTKARGQMVLAMFAENERLKADNDRLRERNSVIQSESDALAFRIGNAGRLPPDARPG